MVDYWGNVIPRYYKIETFANAVESMLARYDPFITRSVRQVLGAAPLSSLSFELFQEGAYQLIFRMRAVNQRRAEALFALVAAKQEGAVSRTAEAEHRNLARLHARAPDAVVRPFLGGIVYLPDRHGRANKSRKVYAYVTQWLSGYHELGVDRSHQCFINTRRPHLFSKEETQELKTLMVETIARTYDPDARTCIEMPQIASGDFVVAKPGRGPLRIKLIACRRILRRVDPGKMIDAILNAEWEWAGRPFRLAPEDPRRLAEALVRAVGRETARVWLDEYLRGVSEHRYPQSRYADLLGRVVL